MLARFARRIARRAYALFRPIVRPVLWRVRSFMMAEARAEQAKLAADVQMLAVAVQELNAKLIEGGVGTSGAAEMRALAVTMERALLTLAVERGRFELQDDLNSVTADVVQ